MPVTLGNMTLLIALALFCAQAHAATLKEASGLVQIRKASGDRWARAGKAPIQLEVGDAVRTGYNAHIVIAFDRTAVLETAGNTQLSLGESVPGGVVVNVLFGAVKVTGKELGGRPLEVHAPTASIRARSDSAAWKTVVGGGGNAVIEMNEGQAAVEDAHGGALRMRKGERVEADLAGLHEPTVVPSPARARKEEFAQRMRRELAFDREPDQAQKQVSDQIRREQYELGHLLTDVSGARVRMEDYVVRSSPSSFAYVAMNGRRGAGLSWYSWEGFFDRALPKDLTSVFASLPGSLGAPTPWTLAAFTETRSNGIDFLIGRAEGGHQVDLNHNTDPGDDISSFYDPIRDVFIFVAVGQTAYTTLFDRYGLYANGILKRGWTGTNIQSQGDVTAASASDPISGAILAAPLPIYNDPPPTTYADGTARQEVLESYSDGTQIQYINQAVSFGGGGMSWNAFTGGQSAQSWQGGLLHSAFSQTVSATEFGGRTIQLMLSPRVPIAIGSLH